MRVAYRPLPYWFSFRSRKVSSIVKRFPWSFTTFDAVKSVRLVTGTDAGCFYPAPAPSRESPRSVDVHGGYGFLVPRIGRAMITRST